MKLVIRADATAQMGTGHLMRCLALGQAVKDRGGEVVFVTHTVSDALLQKIKKEFRTYTLPGITARDAALQIFSQENPDWVVLDGYHFDDEYQKAVKKAGFKLLCIDDYAPLGHYYADIVLNQNYGAEKLKYTAEPYMRILAGTRYALLRREFLKYADFNREIPDIAKKILVTMGGADAENHTLKVLQALMLIDEPLQIKVIIGASNPHYESISEEAGKEKHDIELLRAVEDMAPLMAWADLAISAGGSTVWELAFMGLPSLLGIVADNQENAVTALADSGVFISLGWLKEKTLNEIVVHIGAFIRNKELRETSSLKAKTIVDSKGGERISTQLDGNSLKVLFLGGNGAEELANWLVSQGEQVQYTDTKVDAEYVLRYNPDIIVSYNYRHIINKKMIEIPQRGAINLHISLLPWNKGAHPNIWSFLENTPKGVTIHFIDSGIDTGAILLQEEVFFNEIQETLKSSYEKLHEVIRRLFMDNWDLLKAGLIKPRQQTHEGTFHFQKDANRFEQFIRDRGWNVPLGDLKKIWGKIKNEKNY